MHRKSGTAESHGHHFAKQREVQNHMGIVALSYSVDAGLHRDAAGSLPRFDDHLRTLAIKVSIKLLLGGVHHDVGALVASSGVDLDVGIKSKAS
jgi:hypothetical protein